MCCRELKYLNETSQSTPQQRVRKVNDRTTRGENRGGQKAWGSRNKFAVYMIIMIDYRCKSMLPRLCVVLTHDFPLNWEFSSLPPIPLFWPLSVIWADPLWETPYGWWIQRRLSIGHPFWLARMDDPMIISAPFATSWGSRPYEPVRATYPDSSAVHHCLIFRLYCASMVQDHDHALKFLYSWAMLVEVVLRSYLWGVFRFAQSEPSLFALAFAVSASAQTWSDEQH